MTIVDFRKMLDNLTQNAEKQYEAYRNGVSEKGEVTDADEKILEHFEDYQENVATLYNMMKDMLEYNKPSTTEEYTALLEQIGKAQKPLLELFNHYKVIEKSEYAKFLEMVAVISRVDPERNITLEEAVSTTNEKVVKLASDPNYLGPVSDQRHLIRVKRRDGNRVEGVFTRQRGLFEFDPHGVVEGILRDALQKHNDDDVLKEFVQSILKSSYGSSALLLCAMSKEQQKKERKEKDASEILEGYHPIRMQNLGIINTGHPNALFSVVKNNKNIKELLKTVRGIVTEDEIHKMNEEYRLYDIHSTNGISASAGSSKAGRNYAASKIAALLGASEVIPKAERMTAEYGGHHYQGIFVEKGDGIFYNQNDASGMLSSDFGKMNGASFGEEAKVQLAKLQVIDYICQIGNRNLSNLLFRFDDNGTITGVTGVDNELSFNTGDGSSFTGERKHVSLDSILAIPKEMADIIEKLEPNTLVGVLADTGLTKKEIHAAGTRLLKLKNRIEKSANSRDAYKRLSREQIRIYTKEELGNTSLSDLWITPKDRMRRPFPLGYRNVFTLAEKMQHSMDKIKENPQNTEQTDENLQQGKDNRAVEQKPLEGQGVNPDSAFVDTDEVDLVSEQSLREHHGILADYLDTFRSTQHWYQFKHTQFKDMKNGLKQLVKKGPAKIETLKECDDYEKRLLELEKNVKAYISYKMPKNDTGKVGTKRLQEAKELADYLKNYRHSLRSAFNKQRGDQDDMTYKEDVHRRKVDRIANAIVRGSMAKDPHSRLESTAKAEEAVRNTAIFKGMIQEDRFIKSKVTYLDFYADLAEKNPEKVQEAFETAIKTTRKENQNPEKEKEAQNPEKEMEAQNLKKTEEALQEQKVKREEVLKK